MQPTTRSDHALITQTGSRFRRRAVRLLPAIATDEEALAKLIELGIALLACIQRSVAIDNPPIEPMPIGIPVAAGDKAEMPAARGRMQCNIR